MNHLRSGANINNSGHYIISRRQTEGTRETDVIILLLFCGLFNYFFTLHLYNYVIQNLLLDFKFLEKIRRVE